VRKFSPGGAVTTVISNESMYAQTKQWFVPFAVVADSDGNVFVSNGPQIIKINNAGAITPLAGDKSLAGTADGTGDLARFTSVYHMAFGPQGNLFVIDGSYVNPQRIRKISPTGVVTTVAGSEVAGVTVAGNLPGSLTRLSGLAIDSNGHLFVSTTRAILRIVAP